MAAAAQVEGRNPVHEALKALEVRKVIVARGLEEDPKVQEILELARGKGVAVEVVDPGSLDEASATGRHQGIIAFVKLPMSISLGEILSKSKLDVCVLLLDRVQDPQNLGSILRTAEATGVDAVVIPKRKAASPSPAVHRASMGGSLYVPVVEMSLYRAVRLLKVEGVRLVAVDPSGPKSYYDEDLSGAVALVLGGEERGISPNLLERCDAVVSIPMLGRIGSLNVGVAAAIVLYERVRQRTQRQ